MDDSGAAVETGSTGGGSSAPAPDRTAGSTENQAVVPGMGGSPTSAGNIGTPANDNATPTTEGEASAPDAPEKFKLTRGGQEVELSVDEMRSMLSDDYTHTLKANGQEHSMSWGDLQRNAQLGLGAMTKMQEAAAMRKQLEEAREFGRQDPGAYLEQHLLEEGMTARDFYMQQLRSEFEETKRIDALRQQDPRAADEAVRQQERAAIERQQKVIQARKEREAAAQKAAQEKQQYMQSIPRALEAVGLPHTPSTHAHLGRIVQQYRSVGHELSIEDAAAMARDAYVQELRGHITSMAPDALAGFMGDDLRKGLREYELSLTKPAPKQASESAPQDPPPGGGKPRRKRERIRLRDVSR